MNTVPDLTPTGAAILDAHRDGIVTGHPAALTKLIADKLVTVRPDEAKEMTALGHAALQARRDGAVKTEVRDGETLPAKVARLVVVASSGLAAGADRVVRTGRSGRAASLDRGTPGQAMQRAADALTAGDGDALVLLAAGRYGLVRPSERLDPHSSSLRGAKERPPAFLRRQAEQLGLTGAPVIVLADDVTCSEVLRDAFPDCVAPLEWVPYFEIQEQCDRIADDADHRAALWAETARQLDRGVNAEPCEGCRLRHGRVRVSELQPGDAVDVDGHTLLVRQRPRIGRVLLAGGPPHAPKTLNNEPYEVIAVRRPHQPFDPSRRSEALGRKVDAIPPHPCDCDCMSCLINRSAASGTDLAPTHR